MQGLVGDVGSLKKKRSLTPDVLKVSESFQILFVTATLICLNKISPGRKIDTINSELFLWEKNKSLLHWLSSPDFRCNILFDRRDPASAWMSRVRATRCLKLVILLTSNNSDISISLFDLFLQVTPTVKELPLQYQHQILPRESQSMIGQSLLISFLFSFNW